MRQVAMLALAFVIAGCARSAGPSTVVRGDRVPGAGSESVANQPVVARGANSVTLLPISPLGAAIGVDYGYDMPHCGINGAIDIDGTFWEAIGIAADSVDFDGQPGSFRLVSHDEAEFRTTDGRLLHLARHDGAKAFRICA